MFDKTPKAFWGERPRRSIRKAEGPRTKTGQSLFSPIPPDLWKRRSSGHDGPECEGYPASARLSFAVHDVGFPRRYFVRPLIARIAAQDQQRARRIAESLLPCFPFWKTISQGESRLSDAILSEKHGTQSTCALIPCPGRYSLAIIWSALHGNVLRCEA
ncbi:hypothetical protein [Parvibaculum sp.]|uniref:hypothetical protein n=1 Tax=Parvibaculum sp. TaxID=2024848 RepID=UPI0032974B7F